MRSSSPPRASNSLLRFGNLAILSLAALLVLPVISSAQQAPNDAGVQSATDRTSSSLDDGSKYAVSTISPRETLYSFVRLGAEFQFAFANYRETHDSERWAQLAFLLDQWLSLIDLSQVPAVTRRDVGAQTAACGPDISNRIEPPALGDVPDATTFKTDGSASYLIPKTPFRLVRIDSGPRQGEFLFSERTVQMAPRFYRTVERRPLRSSSMVGSWVSELLQLTGADGPGCAAQSGPGEPEATSLWDTDLENHCGCDPDDGGDAAAAALKSLDDTSRLGSPGWGALKTALEPIGKHYLVALGFATSSPVRLSSPANSRRRFSQRCHGHLPCQGLGVLGLLVGRFRDGS